MASHASAARRFRELLARPGLIRSLGAHDVFSALLFEQAGMEMMFLGGFGASASLLGLPDLNLLTLTEMTHAVRRTTARVRVPVIADGDTGHGGLHNVARTVREFEAAGAAGLLLEDQVTPKRCGHFADKQVVTAQEFIARITTAVKARRDPDFTLFARTDALAVNGLDDAIDRANAAADAGADVAFVEAPQTQAELEAIPMRVRLPVLANMLTGGVTPILSCETLEKVGYKLAVAPIESLSVCARALQDLCATWKTQGRVDALAQQAMPFAALKDLLGVESSLARSRKTS